MTTPLKPCPFCGASGTVINAALSDYWHECRTCGARSARCATPGVADTNWNHRPGEEAVAEECAKIVEEPSGEYSVGHRKLPYWDGEAKAAEIRKRFGGKA